MAVAVVIVFVATVAEQAALKQASFEYSLYLSSCLSHADSHCCNCWPFQSIIEVVKVMDILKENNYITLWLWRPVRLRDIKDNNLREDWIDFFFG